MGQKHIQCLVVMGIIGIKNGVIALKSTRLSSSSMRLSSSMRTFSTSVPASGPPDIHKSHMYLAIRHAQYAQRNKEVPVGAVIVDNGTGRVVATSMNQVEKNNDITMHAEVDCIRKAAKVLSTWRLSNCTLYTTLEPCPMCLGAILNSRIKTLVYGASDSRVGAVESKYSIASTYPLHALEVVPRVLAEESATLLRNFFIARRRENKLKIEERRQQDGDHGEDKIVDANEKSCEKEAPPDMHFDRAVDFDQVP